MFSEMNHALLSRYHCVTLLCILISLIAYGMGQHDGVVKWEHFLRYWPFVRGIHRFPLQRPVARGFSGFFGASLNKRLNKKVEMLVIWDAMAPKIMAQSTIMCRKM